MTSPRDPKDQNNLIFAVALSILVLMGWQYFFARPELQQEQARQEFNKKIEAQNKGAAPENPPNVGNTPIAPPSSETPVGAQPQAAAPVSREDALKASPRIQIVTPSLDGSIDLKGGRIDDLVLTKYHETVDPSSPKVVLLSPAGSPEPYFAEYGWVPQSGSQIKVPGRDTLWTLESGTKLTPETPVVLSWDNGGGLVFHRTISVDNDYMFKIIDEIENKTQSEVTLLPYARVHRSGHPPSQVFSVLHEGLVGVSGEHGLQEFKFADALKSGVPTTFDNVTGGWLGITDKYWATALVPDQHEPYRAMYSALKARDPAGKDAFQTDYLRGALTVPAGMRKGVEGHLFAGAKQASLIDGYENALGILRFDRMIDWGWFYFITRPLFRLMEFINGIVHNFGITILILTVLVKAAFYPLANKQYESMARMKKLQPEMQRIKEQYKDDTQRQQKEIFELYRTQKINPLAGCWPVLLQIPVFFALYKVLFVTIDMRHAPFFGWIHDLSAPDPTSLFNLFGLLPFDGPSFLHIGIWPLIMGITMWMQMQLNPPQPDPIQQQVFQWMPVVFTFMLASFPAGLVIYWAWSNTLSILQQLRINKKNGAEIHLFENLKRTFAPILRLFGAGSGPGK
ncbi:YidC/Oxa1 family membrane protein insertase [Hyphomicrobium denitrificans 1NES1]|uniref:Membrane protein insertase YidC n=1 Tax=Hyphomicrobium denitrificans 1NES1 TaxID=670307 RepID=N0BHD8_9HYPH|nr:membrane protein insertase YidC [Hyphomicrobium denitrificans]AGK59866.1 YidC/Oxa1 family membrane protein insertase [Hyphomicrobium denitrificans 1NES1]